METRIEFNSQNGFKLGNKVRYIHWLFDVAQQEGREIGGLGYVFCSDNFLLDINQRYLNHDTLTDIITFDYSESGILSGEIYISTERVQENASKFEEDFLIELRRVMVHGLLHLLGYKDKTEEEIKVMRAKELEYIHQFSD